MTQDVWNPAQYERFRDERSQPFFDVLSFVRPRPGMRVVDLGCGTGELTRALHRRLEARETLGIDSSESMLARSRAHAGEGLRFERRDILAFIDDPRGQHEVIGEKDEISRVKIPGQERGLSLIIPDLQGAETFVVYGSETDSKGRTHAAKPIFKVSVQEVAALAAKGGTHGRR